MLRKLLIGTAALGAFGAIAVPPTLVTSQALAAAPKCLNKANKHVACTDKLKAKTQRKKGSDHLLRVDGIQGEAKDMPARRGPRLRAR